jgi:hypothetical protein
MLIITERETTTKIKKFAENNKLIYIGHIHSNLFFADKTDDIRLYKIKLNDLELITDKYDKKVYTYYSEKKIII